MEQDASITRLKDTQTEPTGRFETGFAGQAAFRPEANARHALTAPRRRPRAARKTQKGGNTARTQQATETIPAGPTKPAKTNRTKRERKPMKKMICLVLVLICVFTIAAPAFAETYPTGTVHVSTWLNVHKKPSLSSGLVGYLKNGERVSIIRMDAGISPFYYIKGGIHADHSWADSIIAPVAYGMENEFNAVQQYGYVHKDYITVSY